jgi:putative transcriptional regulator
MKSSKFPKLIKEVRKQLGFSQEDLAHKLGVSFSTINRWENKKSSPSRLAKAQFDRLVNDMKEQGLLNLPSE